MYPVSKQGGQGNRQYLNLMKSTLIVFLGIFIYSVFFPHYIFHFSRILQKTENNPPEVRIVEPTIGQKLKWNSIVRFSIEVDDLEDGKSVYDEIPNNEVFLRVEFLRNDNDLNNAMDGHQNWSNGLIAMSRNTCFNCHRIRTKLVGPSFEDISRRYENVPTIVDSLAKKTVMGSTGVWGEVEMPRNPELDLHDAREMVSWILSVRFLDRSTYYIGTEGAFKTREKIPNLGGRYLLTGMYADHGTDGEGDSSMMGVHSIVLDMIE